MTPDDNSLTAAHARIQSAMKSAWADGLASSSPLALLLVAFDAGDDLGGREAADTLRRALHVHCGRSRDVVLRRQHDEFLALLPDTPPAGARRVGAQIVEAMRGNDGKTSVSVGVAVSVPDDRQSPADLLRRAENLLRRARDGGGDRCLGGGSEAGAQATPSIWAWMKEQIKSGSKTGERRRRG